MELTFVGFRPQISCVKLCNAQPWRYYLTPFPSPRGEGCPPQAGRGEAAFEEF